MKTTNSSFPIAASKGWGRSYQRIKARGRIRDDARREAMRLDQTIPLIAMDSAQCAEA